MPNMTGRPGYRTMEMIGGSSAPYLARTPCVPLFCTSFNRVGNKERFRLPGAGGGSFPLYGGTFARSYSVSMEKNGGGSESCLANTPCFPLVYAWLICVETEPLLDYQGRARIISIV